MGLSYNLFLFTLISLSSNMLNAGAAKSPDLISNICSKADNATNCLEFLKPLYRPGESVLNLTRETVKTGANYLFLVYDEIHVREIEVRNDPVATKIYNKCGVAYTAATNSLLRASQILQGAANYNQLIALASSAEAQAQSCDKNFTPANPEPSDFLTLSKKAQNVCSVVSVISNLLVSGKL